MSTDLVAGAAAFGETDGTGAAASFGWHVDMSVDAAGLLAVATWDGQFATGYFLDEPGVGYVAPAKVRTLDTTTFASATPAGSITTLSEQWSGSDLTFKLGFTTVPAAIGEGPAGSWLVGTTRRNVGFALSDADYLSLPTRSDAWTASRRWELVNKSSGAVTDVTDFSGSFPAPRSVVNHSGDMYGFTDLPSTVDHFDSSGAYVGNVDMSTAMTATATSLGIDPTLGEIRSVTEEGGDIWLVTQFPRRLWRINGGPTGTADVVLLSADASADPGSGPRMPGGVPQSVSVNATDVFILIRDGADFGSGASALYRFDRTTLAPEMIAGLGTADPGDEPSMVLYDDFLWIAQTFTETTQIFRVPVDQIKAGWTVGSIAMTPPE